jgi:ATP-dependent Clp protease ATP-binding subunit ClpX
VGQSGGKNVVQDGGTFKCSFCGQAVASINAILHRNGDDDKDVVCLCRKCAAGAAHAFNFRNLKSDILNENPNSGNNTKETCPAESSEQIQIKTPREIFSHLQRHVIGQDQYLKELSIFATQHLTRAKRFLEGEDISTLGKKKNILILGGSGCGKSWSITQLARIIGVPVSFGDATRLTEMGYVGEDIDDILRVLFSTSTGKLGAVGVCVIDEIDKVCRSRGKPDDVTHGAVQNAMLRALDGYQFEIFTSGDKRKSSEKMLIDTRMIPFICMGAFSDLEVYDKRIQERIGFRKTPPDSDAITETDLAHKIIAHGFYEEFISRFDSIHLINSLTVTDMIQILNNPNGGFIRNEKDRFKQQGINLEIKQDAVRAIATKAFDGGTGGARNLSSQLHGILKGIEFEYFGTGKQVDVIVYADDDGEIKLHVKENKKGKKKNNSNESEIVNAEIGTAQKIM